MRRKRRGTGSLNVFHTFYIEFKEAEYEVKISARLVHDSSWGADADGNRGITMDFIEDVYVIDVSKSAAKLSAEDQAEIERLALAMANGHDWSEDIYEPEHDYDRVDDF